MAGQAIVVERELARLEPRRQLPAQFIHSTAAAEQGFQPAALRAGLRRAAGHFAQRDVERVGGYAGQKAMSAAGRPGDIPAQEIPIVYGHDSDYEYNSKGWNVGVRFELAASPDDPAVRAQLGAMVKGYITAWDPVTQTEKWRVQHPNMWNGGLLSTAGNLVFQGNAEGEFVAYTADSGERLWSSYAQTGVVAGPVTYTVDGEQYVAVAAGWGGSFAMVGGELAKRSKGSTARPRVLVYKLGGTHELPPEPTPEQMAVVTPIEQIGDEAMITEGLKQYMANCHMCHGDRAVSGSSVPDLRMMSEASWELFYPIVQGGLRHQQGMVGFGDRLNKDQIDSIYAYLVKRRNDLAAGID